jgi:hypothetical protein
MKKSKLIFGSRSELEAYEIINKHLPEGWKLYGNTPLSQIVDVKREELAEKKWDFYLKASVDFVLTNTSHEPALAIEFDGLGGGFSSGEKYILNKKIEQDPYRELKMNFKIDLCNSVKLPLIVISFEEIRSLANDDCRSIVNSIIGLYIASGEIEKTFEKWGKEGRDEGKSFDDIMWESARLETELNFKYDPALISLDELSEEYEKLGADFSAKQVFKPDPLTMLREKKPYESLGWRYIIKGGKLPVPVIMTVWVRNFSGTPYSVPPHGINPEQVAYNIAWYLATKKAVEIARKNNL